MRSLCRGLLPPSSSFMAARACVVGLLVVVGGCASNKQPSYVAGPAPYAVPAAIPPQQMAHARSKSVPKADMEDDGLPAQTAPPARIRQEADDPSEPFSPNYGGPRTHPAPAPRKAVQSARLSDAAADALIRKAIAAHEMRNQ